MDAGLVGIVLAAGAGRRMGRPKAELHVDGERLLDRAVRVLRTAGLAQVVAVVRPGTAVDDARVVENPCCDWGLRSSLVAGLDAADPAGAALVCLVDVPGVTAATVAAVAAACRPGRIAAATFGERLGHPIAMEVSRWRAAVELAGPDEGARGYLRLHPDVIDRVATADSPDDLDTPADLARFLAALGPVRLSRRRPDASAGR